jgi:hypothetical protein
MTYHTWTGAAAVAPKVVPCGWPSASCPERPRAPVLCRKSMRVFLNPSEVSTIKQPKFVLPFPEVGSTFAAKDAKVWLGDSRPRVGE